MDIQISIFKMIVTMFFRYEDSEMQTEHEQSFMVCTSIWQVRYNYANGFCQMMMLFSVNPISNFKIFLTINYKMKYTIFGHMTEISKTVHTEMFTYGTMDEIKH